MKKVFTGFSGVLILMTSLLLSAEWVSSFPISVDEIRLSLNFKAHRELQYQSWLSLNAPSDFLDRDNVNAKIQMLNSEQDIFIRSLPTPEKFIDQNKENFGYRIQMESPEQKTIFLFSENLFSNLLDKIYADLISNKILFVEIRWKKLFINGLDQGSYLSLSFPEVSMPSEIPLTEFINNYSGSSAANFKISEAIKKTIAPGYYDFFSVVAEGVNSKNPNVKYITFKNQTELDE